jgi:hypothetical protein
MPQMLMKHDRDPGDVIRDSIGDISNINVFYSSVLVAIYKRPEVTASNIHLTHDTRREEDYQGKACLVLKLGPLAFVDTADVKFHGQRVDPGDWIAIRPSDGFPIEINNTKCRMVSDVSIKLKIGSPDLIW